LICIKKFVPVSDWQSRLAVLCRRRRGIILAVQISDGDYWVSAQSVAKFMKITKHVIPLARSLPVMIEQSSD